MGEFDIIGRYFDRGPARRVDLGVGDDCALLGASVSDQRAITTDMLVAGRHFFADVDPRSLGHKALAVNLSDLAAMGARPEAFTLAIALPAFEPQWLDAFAAGLFSLADAEGCELIGGDTTRGPLCISITAIGRLPAGSALRRDGDQPGDDVWVSGALGGAAAVVAMRAGQLAGRDATHLPETLALRLDWPQPRLALGTELRHLASAAIDVSDGLLADLGHIADRSRLALQLQAERVPVDPSLSALGAARALDFALAGGDDYELAFAAPAENRLAIEALGARLGLPLSRIGVALAGEGVSVADAHGRPVAVTARGFDHFAGEPQH
ncbi:MAG: thiamine-phosphate kinase [Burkholderiaceae bacterium]